MRHFRIRTFLTSGAAVAALSCGSAALAQQVNNNASPVEEVTVTGTSIRGVAPIGSNLVSVDRDSMEKMAAINATEMTNSVPAITQSGSAAQGENTWSYYAPSIHGLGGSASNTTLVIVDGMRMPGGGVQFGQTDPNIIPSSALQRVEVLADGASSVYGSDAVAGVINYITRREFQGLEFSGRVGVADSWNSGDLSGIWGQSWNNGAVYVAGQYSYQSSLANSARDFLNRGNYSAQGGWNFDTVNCSPASISTPNSGGNIYLSPSATSAVSATAAQVCNGTLNGDVLPSSERINGMVRITQNVNDRLTLTGTANYSHLISIGNAAEGSVTGITVYGAGSGMGGQINPFFRAPVGDPTATSETINWSAALPGTPGKMGSRYGTTTTSNDTLFLYGNAEYKLSDSWSVKLSDSFGHSRSSYLAHNTFCSSCAILALNGTTQANASTTTPSIGGSGTNIIALNTPLTATNALDVWGANGGATSASVIQQLYSQNTFVEHWNNNNQAKLEVQGPLFDLPAGPVRFAAGAEYVWYTQDVTNNTAGGLGAAQNLNQYFIFSLARNVYSGYAEMVVPVVSPEMGVPLMQSLDFDISARYDHYSDVGSTSNPKIAVNWKVSDGLKVRANYATAFVAEPMATIGIPSAGYRRYSSGTSVDPAIFPVSVALYPGVASLPGCAGQTVYCLVGTPVNQGLTRSYGVGPNAKPETGNSWSVGLDYKSNFLPGFTAALTLWNNRFKGGVDTLSFTQQLTIPSLNRLTICPSGCSTAQINAFINSANGGTLDGTLPSHVYYLRNNDLGNVVNLRVQGIDFDLNYAMETDHSGTFMLGVAGTWFTKFDQDFPGLSYSLLGTSGYNTTYPSVQGHARFHAGWSLGAISLDSFVNYTTAYRNWSYSSANPVITNASFAPVGGGDHVNASTTLDLHGEYAFGQTGWFGNVALYVDVKNLLDSAPPFYSGNTYGVGVGGNGFNGFISSPIGRMATVGFRTAF